MKFLKKFFSRHSSLIIHYYCQQGVTLVEMLIYMGLLAILLMILTEMFVSILDVRTESEATSAVEQDGRYILARLSYDVRRAQSITTPAALGNTSNNLVLTVPPDTYEFKLVGDELHIFLNTIDSGSLNGSESKITGLPTFQKIGNSGGKETIKLNLTVESRTQRKQGPETKSFQTTIGRR